MVYNANKLAKLVKEKAKMHNWLDYYQLRFERNASKRPTTKVIPHTKNSCSFPSYGFVIFESNMNPFKKFILFFWNSLVVQTGFLGCFGTKVDAIEYYTSEIERIENEVS